MDYQSQVIQKQFPLGFQWPTIEPFLFCVHHFDHYPKGQAHFGPDPKMLVGRNRGDDFIVRDGFRMYHGETVPGFPAHPHRGFETITIVRRGWIDHADSLGAAGRYGDGDVQWMTAGSGIQHSEMFPLLHQEQDNPLELFQIWLNLPQKSKMVPPHFKMFWKDAIPTIDLDEGRVSIRLIAGDFAGKSAIAAPPDSWAASAGSEVLILLVRIAPGGVLCLAPAAPDVGRMLYLCNDAVLSVNAETVRGKVGLQLNPTHATRIEGTQSTADILLLQARAIGEPVAQRGPFVMNSEQELRQAFADFRNTGFGGWPWDRPDPIHGDVLKKFAKFPGGQLESDV